jgi:hypothetical protein
MVRFPSMLYGTVVFLGALGMVQAQVARPVTPAQGASPARIAPPSQPRVGQIPAPAATPAPIPNQPAQQNQTSPARPLDGPPVPPVVTFRDSLLTVQAPNSNLSSVLTAIRNKAGIEFEGAENVSERVAISLGPAPAGEVLSAILAGSKYDFVAIGRTDNPAIVQRVILTVKNKPGGATEAQQQQPHPADGQEGEDSEDNPDETVNSPGGDPQDTPVQPLPQPPPQAQAPPQQQTQPPTPEQLLQQLQEMRNKQNIPKEEGIPNQAPRKPPQL